MFQTDFFCTSVYKTNGEGARMCRSGTRTVATVTAVGWVPQGALHQPPRKKVPEHIWVPAGALKSHDRLLFAAKPLDWHPFASLWSLIFSLEYASSLGERAQELKGWRVHKCESQNSHWESYGDFDCDAWRPNISPVTTAFYHNMAYFLYVVSFFFWVFNLIIGCGTLSPVIHLCKS